MPKPGIPEAFRVLMKELQSLGLDMRVQDADGNEVDIKQNYDDDDMGFTPSDDLFDEPTVEDGELDGYSTEEHEDETSLTGTTSRPMEMTIFLRRRNPLTFLLMETANRNK